MRCLEGHPLVFIEEAEVELAADRGGAAASTSIASGPTSPKCANATRSDSTSPGPTRSSGGARPASARRAKISPTFAIREPSSNTDALVIAAQRRRRELDDLIKRTPADGMVAGTRPVNGDLFDEAHSRCVVMSYDYTVLAGTQGQQNHRKKDRMFETRREAPAAGGLLHRRRRRAPRRHRRYRR